VRVIWDADVVLDVMLDRGADAAPAARLMTRVERGEIVGYLCDTTVMVLHGVARRLVGAERAARELRKVLLLFDVTSVNRVILESALVHPHLEFEDAILYGAAKHIGAEALVTRSFPAFKGAEVPVATPEKLLKMLNRKGRAHAESWT